MKQFREAKRASLNSDHNIRVGASLKVKGKTISVGFNQRFKTHPLTRKYHETQTIHAELSCLVRCKVAKRRELFGATLYVYRELRNTGVPAMAKPCKTCTEILKLYGVKKIVYTTDGGGFKSETLIY